MDDELMTVPVPLDSEPTSSLGGDEHHEKKVKLSGKPTTFFILFL
jgi:hypothetical protein